MIHSLAGGVLADGEIYTFAKVRAREEATWYLVPELVFVKEGDRVLVPEGHLSISRARASWKSSSAARGRPRPFP